MSEAATTLLLEARIAELEAALRPFATMAEWHERDFDGPTRLQLQIMQSGLLHLSHLRQVSACRGFRPARNQGKGIEG